MDENEFFHRATLRICENLEIEKALASCLSFLRDVMPVDRMFLQCYDHGYGAMRTIASASPSGFEKLDLLTPLSEEARVSAKGPTLPPSQDIFIFNDPQKYAISREMLEYHKVPCTSLMVMLLKSNGRALGSLVLITEGKEKYNTEHERMVSLLKEPFLIAMSNNLEHREVLKLKDLLADDNRYLHGELRRLSGDEIIGANFGLQETIEKVRQVAELDSPVLLLGETGTGKDVIANAIHYSSSRAGGPFVSVNCGAIPDTLINSELFGHEKGAFTGAISQKRGRFERADKGTIFLDEIAELPLQSQVRLLHVLQNKIIERVGGTKTISLDIRVIAATNQDLEAKVKAGEFREDLWFRLNVFPIEIPPLRERKADIPALLQHFITLKAKELKFSAIPAIAPGAVDFLMEYGWPGNVRELQNVVERALILNRNGPVNFNHLNLPHTGSADPAAKPGNRDKISNIEKLDDVISLHIRRILNKTNGKIHGPGGAAHLLGINASTLRNRMNKLGIQYGKSSK
ncbi:MAG: AAA family ATPase [bacterium]|nr:AAA family ATPase [bacterium]